MDLLAQMTTFVRIVDAGSVTAAARVLRLSVPATSRQLRALEDELGTTLVVRTTRKLRITDEGHEWYAHCVRILGEVADARASVGRSDRVRGRLVVSVPISLGTVHVVPRLAPLVARHPALRIDLRLEDELVDLVAEGVDVVVRVGAELPDSSSLVALPFLRFDRILVATPAYLRKHGTPKRPGALAEHACLGQRGNVGSVAPWRLLREGERVELAVGGPLTANAPIALHEAVRCDLGIALLPDWLVAHDVTAGRLRRVLPEWSGAPSTAWAVYPTELRNAARVRAFVEHLRSDAAVTRRSAATARR